MSTVPPPPPRRRVDRGDLERGDKVSPLRRLWYINGAAYELSPFLDSHPGGAEALLAVRGQDCTQVFLENHPFTNPVEMLAQYEVSCERLKDLLADEVQSQTERRQVRALVRKITKEATRVLAEEEDEEAPRGGRDVIDPGLLWFIHGRAYDLRAFLRLHPGGQEALLQERGRDCTAQFEQIHPFTDAPRRLLAKFKEVKLPPTVLRQHCLPSSSTFSHGRDPLWETLRVRCRRLLRRRRLEEQAAYDEEEEEEEEGEGEFSSHRPLMSWTTFVLHLLAMGLAGLLYCYGYINESPAWACLAGVGMGLLAWVAGRLGHEGLHHAISRHAWINTLCGTLGAFGLYTLPYWEAAHNDTQHNDMHAHGSNNYSGGPPSFSSASPIPGQKRGGGGGSSSSSSGGGMSLSSSSSSIKEGRSGEGEDSSVAPRYLGLGLQHLLRYAAWSTTTFSSVLLQPLFALACAAFATAARQSKHQWGQPAGNYPSFHVVRVLRQNPLTAATLLLHWVAFLALFLGVPLWQAVYHARYVLFEDQRRSLLQIILHRVLALAAYLGSTGLLLGTFTTVTCRTQPELNKKNPKNQPYPAPVVGWAQQQVKAAVTFAPSSLLWNVLSQGYNLQIEHRLFPGLPSDKLPLLAPVVKATCHDFGVHYQEFATFGAALSAAHQALDLQYAIRRAGREPRRRKNHISTHKIPSAASPRLSCFMWGCGRDQDDDDGEEEEGAMPPVSKRNSRRLLSSREEDGRSTSTSSSSYSSSSSSFGSGMGECGGSYITGGCRGDGGV